MFTLHLKNKFLFLFKSILYSSVHFVDKNPPSFKFLNYHDIFLAYIKFDHFHLKSTKFKYDKDSI